MRVTGAQRWKTNVNRLRLVLIWRDASLLNLKANKQTKMEQSKREKRKGKYIRFI